ncbi:hypothetical protein G210_0220 [Candida maltosa Xu316]|uniref:Inner kinetochore subunit AME1 domain-containing protein n=1 Tax=Candida maltosa (strain Xu316) TaxID=1245528 RepID=M3IRG1_CANMX|nr:hypothetical protein G210_0220 [Candida maltosa Xu316]
MSDSRISKQNARIRGSSRTIRRVSFNIDPDKPTERFRIGDKRLFKIDARVRGSFRDVHRESFNIDSPRGVTRVSNEFARESLSDWSNMSSRKPSFSSLPLTRRNLETYQPSESSTPTFLKSDPPSRLGNHDIPEFPDFNDNQQQQHDHDLPDFNLSESQEEDNEEDLLGRLSISTSNSINESTFASFSKKVERKTAISSLKTVRETDDLMISDSSPPVPRGKRRSSDESYVDMPDFNKPESVESSPQQPNLDSSLMGATNKRRRNIPTYESSDESSTESIIKVRDPLDSDSDEERIVVPDDEPRRRKQTKSRGSQKQSQSQQQPKKSSIVLPLLANGPDGNPNGIQIDYPTLVNGEARSYAVQRPRLLDVVRFLVNKFEPAVPSSKIALHEEFKDNVLMNIDKIRDMSSSVEDIARNIRNVQIAKERVRQMMLDLRKEHTEVDNNMNLLRLRLKTKKEKADSLKSLLNQLRETKNFIRNPEMTTSSDGDLNNKVHLQLLTLQKVLNPTTGIHAKLQNINQKLEKLDNSL